MGALIPEYVIPGEVEERAHIRHHQRLTVVELEGESIHGRMMGVGMRDRYIDLNVNAKNLHCSLTEWRGSTRNMDANYSSWDSQSVSLPVCSPSWELPPGISWRNCPSRRWHLPRTAEQKRRLWTCNWWWSRFGRRFCKHHFFFCTVKWTSLTVWQTSWQDTAQPNSNCTYPAFSFLFLFSPTSLTILWSLREQHFLTIYRSPRIERCVHKLVPVHYGGVMI